MHPTPSTEEKLFLWILLYWCSCLGNGGDRSLLNKHKKKPHNASTLPSCDSESLQQPYHFTEMTPFLLPALPRAMSPTDDSFPTMSQLLEMGSFDFLDEEPDMEPGEN